MHRQINPEQLTIKSRFALLTLLLSLIVYAYAGSFMRLEVDDFCVAFRTEEYGVMGMASNRYNIWSGRYTFFLAAGVLYDLFGFYAPAILPGLLIVGLVAALLWALRPYTAHASLLALGITFAFVEGQLSLWQNLYWMSGSLTYIAPLIGGIWLVGWLYRHWRSWQVSSWQVLANRQD